MVKVAINGFGRIGRRVFRLLQAYNNIQVVAINDLADTKTLSHLLKYDSVHGLFNGQVTHDDDHIIVNNNRIPLLNHKHPKDIDWNKLREYEKEDNTRGSQELACTAGSCELVDI